MSKSRKKKGVSRKPHSTHPKINLTDDQYNQRLLTLLEAREAQNNGQHVYFDLGAGERPQVVKAEFDHVARREKIPVLVHPVKGKPTLAFVFPPGPAREPEVIVRGRDGGIKFQTGGTGL